MTRTIKASEVKPGMTIRWEQGGITYECTVSTVGPATFGVNVMARRSAATIYNETPVTVLSEPAPPQPEEPTEFGAKVIVDGRRFLRADDHVRPWLASEVWTWYTWAHLCSLGPVQVVPDQGWGIATGDPEVPERIEEWPDDDTALRDHKWRGRLDNTWIWDAIDSMWEGRSFAGIYIGSYFDPTDAPFIRVTDA